MPEHALQLVKVAFSTTQHAGTAPDTSAHRLAMHTNTIPVQLATIVRMPLYFAGMPVQLVVPNRRDVVEAPGVSVTPELPRTRSMLRMEERNGVECLLVRKYS